MQGSDLIPKLPMCAQNYPPTLPCTQCLRPSEYLPSEVLLWLLCCLSLDLTDLLVLIKFLGLDLMQIQVLIKFCQLKLVLDHTKLHFKQIVVSNICCSVTAKSYMLFVWVCVCVCWTLLWIIFVQLFFLKILITLETPTAGFTLLRKKRKEVKLKVKLVKQCHHLCLMMMIDC